MKKTPWGMALLAIVAVWSPTGTWAAPDPATTPTITVRAGGGGIESALAF